LKLLKKVPRNEAVARVEDMVFTNKKAYNSMKIDSVAVNGLMHISRRL
jgi:hypothetical protein